MGPNPIGPVFSQGEEQTQGGCVHREGSHSQTEQRRHLAHALNASVPHAPLLLRGNDPLSPSVSLLRPELRGLPHQSLAREGTVTGSAPPLPAAEAGVRAADRLPQGFHVETRAVTLRSDPRTHARFLSGMCLEQEFLTGMEFHAQRMKLSFSR